MTRILIVDDERNILVSLTRALELEGYEVDGASTLADGRTALEKTEYALVMLDLKLPDGTGIDLLNEIVMDANHPPVVMMSGHGTIDDAVKALHRGGSDFLEKPIGQERLLHTISRVLELSRLKAENAQLRTEAMQARGGQEILGRSKVVSELLSQVERVAQSEGRVLITGENGTGKELIAHAIHARSLRKDKAFVSLNCAAVPAELIESELFGHEKGAFTGAVSRKIGKFECADGGTLFLDEVGDTPAAMQAKLLRVLQTGELERVGGNRTIRVDVRVLAATNKDLQTEIDGGRFREDLYYRLNVVPLTSPPLRQRKEDIPVLVQRFLEDASARNHRKVPTLTAAALGVLAGHDYPGNIRELKNLVERIVILAPPDVETLDEPDVRTFVPSKKAAAVPTYRPGKRLSELVTDAERQIVVEAMEAHGNVVADTARALGVERSNFHKKLKALGLR